MRDILPAVDEAKAARGWENSGKGLLFRAFPFGSGFPGLRFASALRAKPFQSLTPDCLNSNFKNLGISRI